MEFMQQEKKKQVYDAFKMIDKQLLKEQGEEALYNCLRRRHISGRIGALSIRKYIFKLKQELKEENDKTLRGDL